MRELFRQLAEYVLLALCMFFGGLLLLALAPFLWLWDMHTAIVAKGHAR